MTPARPSPSRLHPTFGLVVAALVVMTAAQAFAGRPYVRMLRIEDGVPRGEVEPVVQDAQGLIWFGTDEGVQRWDGRRVVDMDGEAIKEGLWTLLAEPSGSMMTTTGDGEVWRLTDGSTTRMVGPDGEPLMSMALDLEADGSLLAVTLGALWRWRDGIWQAAHGSDTLWTGARIDAIHVLKNGDVLLARAASYWRVPLDGGEPVELIRMPSGTRWAAESDDGTLWLVDWDGLLVAIDPSGNERVRRDFDGNPSGLAKDGNGLWLASGFGLFHVDADGKVRTWDDGVVGGGELIVDRDGSLWVASYDGLQQLPTPEVLTWGREQGLPVDLTRTVRFGPNGQAWAGSWLRPGFVDVLEDKAYRLADVEWAKGTVCPDGDGVAWFIGNSDVKTGMAHVYGYRSLERVHDSPVRTAWSSITDCATGPDGTVWLATSHDLLLALRSGQEPLAVASPLDRAVWGRYRTVHVEPDGRIWLAAGPQVCGADRDDVVQGDPAWTCSSLPDPSISVLDLVRTDAGRLWAATHGGGIWTLEQGGWAPLPGSHRLASLIQPALEASVRGGVWMGGHGLFSRVHDVPDHPDGFEVIDDLSLWLGGQIARVADISEEQDGTVWVAHGAGVTRVPVSAQTPSLRPPPVALLEARVDGKEERDPLLNVPSTQSLVRLRFAAASYRAPQLLRYRTRLDGGAWTEPVQDPVFELQGLDPGAHRFEVAATLDGRRWSDPPRVVALLAPRPWYGRAELWALATAGLSLLAFLAYRLQVRLALRVERLRTRIAMDLHDEVGAGLGAIGLLGDLLQRDLPGDSIKSVAGDIAETSGELSEALRSIVWSLQPASQHLDALGRYLEDRARNIVPGIHQAGRLHVYVAKGAKDVVLPVDVLRNVQLIALESLHNIAKHAHARTVHLTIEPAGRRWRLVVQDDGQGLGDGQTDRVDHGVGLGSMHQRALDIHADLTLRSPVEGGTEVVLLLPRPHRWPLT